MAWIVEYECKMCECYFGLEINPHLTILDCERMDITRVKPTLFDCPYCGATRSVEER